MGRCPKCGARLDSVILEARTTTYDIDYYKVRPREDGNIEEEFEGTERGEPGEFYRISIYCSECRGLIKELDFPTDDDVLKALEEVLE